jgi:hypothetical protein
MPSARDVERAGKEREAEARLCVRCLAGEAGAVASRSGAAARAILARLPRGATEGAWSALTFVGSARLRPLMPTSACGSVLSAIAAAAALRAAAEGGSSTPARIAAARFMRGASVGLAMLAGASTSARRRPLMPMLGSFGVAGTAEERRGRGAAAGTSRPARMAAARFIRGAMLGAAMLRGGATSARARPEMPSSPDEEVERRSSLVVRTGAAGSSTPMRNAAARERRGCLIGACVEDGKGRARKAELVEEVSDFARAELRRRIGTSSSAECEEVTLQVVTSLGARGEEGA